MKTNLQDLMNRVSNLQNEQMSLEIELKTNCKNEEIIELNGDSQFIKDNTDFKEKFHKYILVSSLVALFKGIIAEKNCTLKIKDLSGNEISLQQAIINNKFCIQHQIFVLNTFIEQNESKERISKQNDAYFISYTLPYDKEEMEILKMTLQKELQHNELEISKVNAQEFEIDDEILKAYKDLI